MPACAAWVAWASMSPSLPGLLGRAGRRRAPSSLDVLDVLTSHLGPGAVWPGFFKHSVWFLSFFLSFLTVPWLVGS